LRQKVAEVLERLFCGRGPGLSLETAAEILAFDVGDLRAALKVERTRR
jgi:hypothetical protein